MPGHDGFREPDRYGVLSGRGVPSKAPTVEGSTLVLYKTGSEGYQSTTERQFCSACGSPVFGTIESMPGAPSLRQG